MLSTIYTFNIFANWFHEGVPGSAPKKFFSKYFENDKEFLNTIVEHIMFKIKWPFFHRLYPLIRDKKGLKSSFKQ